MPRRTTTLYIGDTSIRLMVTRGKRITKLADVPLDTSLSDIDTEAKKAELVNRIKLLFKTNKIRSKKVILGISGLHCLTRPVTLPELPSTMIDEAITREAKRVLPVSPEQLYITWQAVGNTEGKIQAFMVAIPKQIADTLLGMLNQAGFKPYLMDIKPLALARLSREATAIIVDVQANEFDIVIMVNGLPQPIRTVTFPQESLSLPEKFSIVKDELKRTIQFYNSNNLENGLQKDDTMLVSGEMVEEPELYESLAKELGFKVELLSSPLKCVKQLDPSHHLTNVGLALKVATREAGPLLPNFNTLPVPYLPKQVSIARLLAIPTAAVAIGSIVLLGMTIQNTANNIETIKSELESNNFILEKRNAQKTALTSDIATKEQRLVDIDSSRNTYTAALNTLDQRGDQINTNLEAIVDNVVADLDLINIGLTDSQVALSGLALSEVEIIKYARNLDATDRFSEITISSITRISSTDNESSMMSFSLAIDISGGSE